MANAASGQWKDITPGQGADKGTIVLSRFHLTARFWPQVPAM